MSQDDIDKQLFANANRVIPGGVNSPVRAFNSVGGTPVFIRAGRGAYLIGADGKKYIDYVGSWGASILGHAPPEVVQAIVDTAARGLSFGAPTVLETELAELICQSLPWLDKVRMVNSGTEAAMSAIRLARGFTGRDKIVKFEGCYHGHADGLLVKAGSGALTFGVPTSAGVPAEVAKHTLTAKFNDSDSVSEIFTVHGNDIAAVIVEPVAGNMNCILPAAGFLQHLRELCDQHGSLLIMDEVMTGFRVGPAGAQGRYAARGDITVLGKVIGGGMPVGAFGASSEIMAKLAPVGAVYQAGTLSGNPLAMAAGIATLRTVTKPNFYPELESNTIRLTDGLCQAAAAAGIKLIANRAGGMFGLFFTESELVDSFAAVNACDIEMFTRFFHKMLARGIYFAPSAFEAGFISAAHGKDEIDQTIDIATTVFKEL